MFVVFLLYYGILHNVHFFAVVSFRYLFNMLSWSKLDAFWPTRTSVEQTSVMWNYQSRVKQNHDHTALYKVHCYYYYYY